MIIIFIMGIGKGEGKMDGAFYCEINAKFTMESERTDYSTGQASNTRTVEWSMMDSGNLVSTRAAVSGIWTMGGTISGISGLENLMGEEATPAGMKKMIS